MGKSVAQIEQLEQFQRGNLKSAMSKGFGKLWYGVMFVESKTHTKTPDEVELAAKWGYSSSGNAGEYDSSRDQVYIKNPPKSYVTTIVIHELGHRYWYKFMTPTQRARFNSLVQTKATDKFRDYPQGPTDEEDNLKPVTPFSDYASSNIEEAFAEVFEGYVSGEDLTRDQLESFRSVFSSVSDPVVDAVVRHFIAERSKKIPLGFRVVDTKSGEPLSVIFSRREPAREVSKELFSQGKSSGVETLEAYVPVSWKRGDSLEPYISPELSEALKHKK